MTSGRASKTQYRTGQMTTDVKQKTTAQLTGRHLLGIEGLSVPEMQSLLYRSHYFADIITGERPIGLQTLLKGVSVVNLFFENSTRTREFPLRLRQNGWARLF